MTSGMTIERIVLGTSNTVDEKVDAVAALLSSRPDLGAMSCVETILATDDERVACFAADYLALLAGVEDQKQRALVRLLASGEKLVIAASNLAAWMRDDQMAEVIKRYLASPDRSGPLYSVVYEIARYAPDRLRVHEREINDPALRTSMLPGGPDAWVESTAARYRAERDVGDLVDLGTFHTAKACSALLALRGDVPEDDRATWEASLEDAGLLPDGKTPSVRAGAWDGFVAPRHRGPHVLGGSVGGVVPSCPRCDRPAGRVLTLCAAELPKTLRSPRDPSFFWFQCHCDALDETCVQIGADGVHVLSGPYRNDGSECTLVPGERALVLEESRAKHGSSRVTPGYAHHQVAGFAPWVRPTLLPKCPLCRTPMLFLAAIDSGMTPFGRMGFDGMLFGVWCDACAVSCMFQQRD